MRNLWIVVLAYAALANSETPSGVFDKHGCPDGWVTYEESCYLFDVEQTFNWTEAAHFCSNHLSSNLVVIDSKGEHDFLKYFVRKFTQLAGNNKNMYVFNNFGRTTRMKALVLHTYYWIGATDAELEGQWIWYTDHRNVSDGYHEWGPNEPNNVGNQDCACLYSSLNWTLGDAICAGHHRLICEKNLTETLTLAVVG